MRKSPDAAARFRPETTPYRSEWSDARPKYSPAPTRRSLLDECPASADPIAADPPEVPDSALPATPPTHLPVTSAPPHPQKARPPNSERPVPTTATPSRRLLGHHHARRQILRHFSLPN